MPATPTLTSHQPSTTSEVFDAETLALLDALDVGLPGIDDAMVDLDIYYGTPLEMYDPPGLREIHRHGAETAARVDAACDIVATDPTVIPLVRERLADLLLPHTEQIWLTGPPAPSPIEFPAAA
ncbi:hypothetical protein ACFQ9J_26760 [Streptomyces sp. NPDC056529]|uniref:hypothetical protein n=1 Tax=Streptomyces sp. NPDC056529 TaxID=3345855 RepID=UPI0036CE0E8D